MANTVRNAANSSEGTSLADADAAATLLVTSDGFYFGAPDAVALSGGGTRATVSGIISGGFAAGDTAFEASGGGDTLNVLASGAIEGATAVKLSGGNSSLVNHGFIDGTVTGVEVSGTGSVENYGTIRSSGDAIYLHGILDESGLLRNAGVILGDVKGDSTWQKIENSGEISGAVELLGESNDFTNTGTLRGSFTGSDFSDYIANSGLITGEVLVGGGHNKIVNSSSGEIKGLVFGEGDEGTRVENAGAIRGVRLNTNTPGYQLNYILNRGTISDGVIVGESETILDNSGTIYSGTGGAVVLDTFHGNLLNFQGGKIYGSVRMGEQGDHVLNRGYMIGGIDLKDGADTFLNEGEVAGNIECGAGDDSYWGDLGTVSQGYLSLGGGDDVADCGNGAETVDGGEGKDTIKLAGGRDVFLASAAFDGNDKVDGGASADLYDASNATGGVHINLANGIARGVGIGTDRISNFESATGSAFRDELTGSDGANILKGNGGGDKLCGGGGRDILTGGAGADRFVYVSVKDSAASAKGRDLITDFAGGADKLDLSAIDASTKTAGDNDFRFIGTREFTGAAGQLNATFANGKTIVSGDIDGDKVADFSIALTGKLALTAADFVL